MRRIVRRRVSSSARGVKTESVSGVKVPLCISISQLAVETGDTITADSYDHRI